MDRKTISIVLLVVGIVILVVSLAADFLGIGGNTAVFGPRQITGAVVGAVLIVVGLILRPRK